MEAELQNIRKELMQIRMTLEMMKRFIVPEKDPEGELSDWAEQELAEARATPRSEFTSLEDLEKEIKDDLHN